jgi:putative transposase
LAPSSRKAPLRRKEEPTHDWQSLSHVRWECKYHVVIITKYRRKVFYGRLRRQIGAILRGLCRQRGIELVESHAMPDHVHL